MLIGLLQKSGVALKIDRSLPSLVNLNEDPQLNELLFYVLHEGAVHVGRAVREEDGQHCIQLQGPLIADKHWLVAASHNHYKFFTETSLLLASLLAAVAESALSLLVMLLSTSMEI
jgi:hypothetical protein